jgi:hypothetical protein
VETFFLFLRAVVADDDEKTAVILVERVQDGPKGRSKSQLWR